MKLHNIHLGNFTLDGGAMFGVVPKTIWNKLVPADENNLCTWALRCLLIEHENRKILIDTGCGDKQDEKFFKHYNMTNTQSIGQALQKIGLHTSDITDVILTHLHFDHCGGAVVLNNGVFELSCPNATYWVSEQQWETATHPNRREKASFLKENIEPILLSGKLKIITLPAFQGSKELQEIKFNEVISLLIVNGHTQGMMLPKITYNEKTIVYMADLLPSIAHLPIPYVMGYDMQPLLTLHEKEVFLQEALEKNYILYFEHDAINECCTVHQTDKGIRAKEIFELNSLN
jgi:glyoxylase-like metal-dependent hydrolase (beta-lactamase superfamily II)